MCVYRHIRHNLYSEGNHMSKRKAAKQRFCECGLNITQGNVQGKLRIKIGEESWKDYS